jgi:hypothetical protein
MTVLKQMKAMVDDIATVARRFDLDTRVGPHEDGFSVLFDDPRRAVYCPCELRVKLPKCDGESLWSDVSIAIDDIAESRIGHNGWRYFTNEDTHVLELGDREECLNALGAALRRAPLVPVDGARADITDDDHFARAFTEIEGAARVIPGVYIECEREDAVESYKFKDGQGRRFRIAFVKEHAVLSVDGEHVGKVHCSLPEEIGEMVAERIAAFKAHDKPRYHPRR